MSLDGQRDPDSPNDAQAEPPPPNLSFLPHSRIPADNPPPPVCPTCSNLLTISPVPVPLAICTSAPDPAAASQGQNRLECRTCPYQYVITKRYYERKNYERKEREDVFGGPGAWDNAQKTQVQCPADGCDGMEAAFFQVQIRSADEPMTSFYKVCVYACFVYVYFYIV
jgi:DNA-directed RNA polymerase III subunit RPC11